MYSIAGDGLRYTVTSIVNQNVIALVDSIVDTGAIYTCYKAEQVDVRLREEQFAGSACQEIGGFVDGKHGRNTVKFYKYSVKQFTIGTINMGERAIWITFDKRITDNVLGMDILQSISFMQEADERTLHFFQNKDEMKEYISN